MKIAIIWATGFVGSKIVQEALFRNHKVVALSRNRAKLPISESIQPYEVDITDTNALATAIDGCDVVVHAFAAPRTESVENRIQKQIEGTTSIIEAVKRVKIKRIIAIGGAGTSEVAPGVALKDSYFFPSRFEGGARSTAVIKELLEKETDLDWVSISPPNFLEEGERTGKYRTGKDNLIVDLTIGRSYISTADYAVAVLDEIENPKHYKQRFTVGK